MSKLCNKLFFEMTQIEIFCCLQNYTIIKELNWEIFVHYNTLKLHGEISKYKKT